MSGPLIGRLRFYDEMLKGFRSGATTNLICIVCRSRRAREKHAKKGPAEAGPSPARGQRLALFKSSRH